MSSVSGNLYEQLIGPLVSAPDTPFMIAGSRTITRGEFLSFTRRLCSRLSSYGLSPGSRVMVQVDKSPEAVMLYAACLQAGLVIVPLNPAYTDAEVEYFIENAEPGLVVSPPRAEARMAEMRQRHNVPNVATLGDAGDGTLLKALDSLPEQQQAVCRGPDDLAAMLYTSGTTGRPKGAMLTHGNLASNCRALLTTWRLSEKDRLIHALPIFHTHGLFVACNLVMAAGASMFFLPQFDAERLIELMPESTVLMGVPTFYTRLLESPGLDPATTRHMRLFISGSAPLQPATHSAFQQRTGYSILERYGMTETNMIASNPYDGERRAGTVGLPLPGVEIRVTDPSTGALLAPGEPGMIEVRGPNVFQGYWRMPDKTASEFRSDGFFITGDLGRVDEQGYLRIVGREKDLVISGGLNVYPSEVENELNKIPDVLESAVIGLPHPDLGEAVTAVVVLVPGTLLDTTQVADFLRARLARYKQPKEILTANVLPRNAMGKVQKNELRERYTHTYADRRSLD